MRNLVLVTALAALPGLCLAVDKLKTDEPEIESKAAGEKPAVRALQLRSSIFQFSLRLEPGVPDPGQVEQVRIEMAELPPVPDPIYGETIPVKECQMLAEVTDADGAGYGMLYQVHQLTDAGAYGFHFTPKRRDTYRVVLRGEHKSQKFSPTFRVPVGIWPFHDPGGSGGADGSASKSTGGRLPAIPGSPTDPALPAAPAGPAVPAGAAASSPVAGLMEILGARWVDLQVALLAGRKPDWTRVKAAAEALRQASLDGAGLLPADPDFTGLMKEQAEALDKLAKAAGSAKAAPVREAFDQLGGRHCNRCHFAKRFGLLASPDEFPGGLP